MMRDDELKKVLDKWETPTPSASLDSRVWQAYTANRKRRMNWKLWGAVAAGVVLVAGLSMRKAPPRVVGEAKVESRLTVAGYRPMKDGAVMVVKAGAKR